MTAQLLTTTPSPAGLLVSTGLESQPTLSMVLSSLKASGPFRSHGTMKTLSQVQLLTQFPQLHLPMKRQNLNLPLMALPLGAPMLLLETTKSSSHSLSSRTILTSTSKLRMSSQSGLPSAPSLMLLITSRLLSSCSSVLPPSPPPPASSLPPSSSEPDS